MKLLICILLTGLLSACGGGGSNNDSPTNSQAVSQSSRQASSLSSSAADSASSQSVSSLSQSSIDGFVWIPDQLLKNAIRSKLNLASNAEITSAQMQTITSLSIEGEVTSLTGIETATQIRSLSVENVSENTPDLDLSPLSELSELISLSLMGFELPNLSPIENLQDIQDLDLSNSRFSDLSPIAELDQLSMLILDNTDLTEVPAFISSFTELYWLSLSDNPLTNNNIAVLSSLDVNNLIISYTEIDNLDFLSGNDALNYLNINGTPVYDLAPLLSSSLGNGDILIANNNCVHLGKYSANQSIVTQLENRGIAVIVDRDDSLIYGNSKVCPNKLDDLTGNASATYTNDNLQISWNFTGAPSSLTCEIYHNLQGQQPRTPISVVNNCHSTLSTTISTAFTNDAISVFVWDGYGSKKLISPTITTTSQAATYLHSYDWGQTIVKADSKLIPNKPAQLRLHLLGSNPTPVPDIQVTAVLNNISTPLTLSKPSQIPMNKNFYSSNQSYRVILDKTLMQPGLSIHVNVAGNEKIITPTFGDENKLYVTLVPIQIEGVTGIIPEHTSVQNALLEYWPFSEINLKNHAVFTSSLDETEDVEGALFELAELQILDGDNSHYYGLYNGYGGVAFLGEPTGIGGDKGRVLTVILHELGHTFNLQHIDCNFPDNPDPLYPYNTNSIGSLGIGSNFLDLYLPDNYTDIMSYCLNNFVSDYSYEKAQDYIEENPSQPFKVVNSQKTSAITERNWLISGVIKNNKTVELRRILPINKKGISVNSEGEYKLQITDTQGILHTHYFDTSKIDHRDNSTSTFFKLTIPYTEISRLEIYRADQLLYRQVEQPAVNSSNNTAAQKSLSIPEVIQSANKLCLHWDNQAYEFASLQLKLTDGSLSTLFMDTTDSPYCVDYTTTADAKSWNIMLRKGLRVREFTQPAN